MGKNIELRFRQWVFVDGTKFFGPGRLELLENIQSAGSIVKAAQQMGMSYKKAWAMVDEMNALGSQPYVITHKGGQNGGGTEVTEAGRKVMLAYRALNDKLQKIIDAEQELLALI